MSTTMTLSDLSERHDNSSTTDFIRDMRLTTLTYTMVFGFICLCLCCLTIVGNLLVLVTFRRMKTVGNLFILSLATADLIVGGFVMPIAGIYALTEKWTMGIVVCQIWLSIDFTASTASIFNLLTLSLDRYWSITSPLQYLGKRTRTRALLLIGAAWGLSLLWIIPIFGWHHFNNGTRLIESHKCEPEYTHSKGFKVSTAIINFYLPLLVLISLNARIYYEIKRRYNNGLLQRDSSRLRGRASSSRLPNTYCDSDPHGCSTTINCTENDSILFSRLSSKSQMDQNNIEPILRMNYKDKRPRTDSTIRKSEQRRRMFKRAYSHGDKHRSTQDDLTWYTHYGRHGCSSYAEPSITSSSIRQSNHIDSYRSHINNLQQTNERKQTDPFQVYMEKNNSKCNSSRSSSSLYNHQQYQELFCRQSTSSNTIHQTPLIRNINIFNSCICCATSTSRISRNSNSYGSQRDNSKIELKYQARKTSSSSISSIAPLGTYQRKSAVSSCSRTRNSMASSLISQSNFHKMNYHTRNHNKQTMMWNQHEKAFRQLFAIVFGFTCCFLPYFILYMVVAFCNSCVSERALTATIWLGYVNSTINPFLYALSNKHFRQTFRRLLKRNNRRSSFYN